MQTEDGPAFWHFSNDGKTIEGPVTAAQLLSMARAGQIRPETQVWKRGMKGWVNASLIRELVFAPPTLTVLPPPLPNASENAKPESGSYAGFGLRFAAFFIDMIVTGLAGGVVGSMVGVAMTANGNTNVSEINAVAALFGLITSLIYFAVMESGPKQATLGKMAVGIKVTDLAGNRVSFGRASGRFFAKYLSSIILGLGFLMIAFTEKRQGLHDMVADCLVVRT